MEQSAKLVEDAGETAAAKLEAQLVGTRTALGNLNEMIDQLAAKAAKLPQEATAQAKEVTQAVEQGLSDLMTAARRAADETQAIDAAFQERVKRNYEMLSEAVQLMGVVASGGQGAAALQRPSPAERGRSRIPVTSVTPLAEPSAPAALPAALPAPTEALTAVDPTSRGRLRLTPTASDHEFKSVFDSVGAQPPPPAEDSAWTWKELLTSIDGEAAGDDVRLGEGLFAEIEGMGIDPAALLPRARVEEIAAVVQSGDSQGAREVVRTLAPAAIRRLSRRLISDAAFRGRCQQLVRRYAQLVGEAVRRDKQGFQAAALLASGAGRAYLLLDALAGQPE
jgi:hypothetical protein